MTHITPVVIVPANGLNHPFYVGRLEGMLRPIETWFDLQRRTLQDNRLAVLYGGVQVEAADIDLTVANPWAQVRAELAARGYPYGENQGQEMTLALVAGWDNPQYAGHAGRGLAVVGEQVFKFDDRGDTSYALWLIAHETAHLVWSMSHWLGIDEHPDVLRPYPAPLEACIIHKPDVEIASLLSAQQPVGCSIA